MSKTYAPSKTQKAYIRYDMHVVCRQCHEWMVAEEHRRRIYALLGAVATALFALWAVATMLALSA